MISSAIWVLISIGKFSKTAKLHASSGHVQFVVFEVFRNAITPNCMRNNVVTC